MVQQVEKQMTQYAPSFANWSLSLFSTIYGQKEIAVVGKEAEQKAKAILQHFLPQSILMASVHESPIYPLLKGKVIQADTLIYVCENYACQKPVDTVHELLTELKST
jgi:uncharacterized protein YyaL (SSP411 family)